MYQLILEKSASKDYDYLFDKFSSFYPIANLITYPLRGQYKIGVKSDSVEDIQTFMQNAEAYSALMIDVLVQQSILDYLTMYNSDAVVATTAKPFDTFKELLSQRNILLDKSLISLLYSSISHDYAEMSATLDLIVNKLGSHVLITEKMLSTVIVLNKAVYPREVLLAYLRMDRHRTKKLQDCLTYFGNDVTVGAMVKNLKAIIKDKRVYLHTGKGNGIIRNLNSVNILLMYRILNFRRGLNDVVLLMDLYERGIYDDIIQRDSSE